MTAAKLEKPGLEHKKSYIEALREFQAEGRYSFLNIREVEENFEEFLEKITTGKKSLHKPYAEWVEPVPETVLWLVKDKEFIGTLNVRHRLNWHLEKWGGHLNFIIRPSMRKKGFGKKLIQKSIPYLNYLGIERALVTVDPEDKASIKLIEFCGGQLQDTTQATDKFPARHRYWLDCT